MVTLTIGASDGAPATLAAERFNRHTFWCGQSGSGKTYALGLVLEQLLLHTRLPLLILDPNADFVGLGTPRDGADAPSAALLEQRDVRVLNSPARDGQRLHVRFNDMNLRTKAAVLRLDPVLNAEEYNVLLQFERDGADTERADFLDSLRASGDPARARLATRVENLGILDWSVWARGQVAAEDVVAERPDATVADLSGFAHPDEPRAAALALLDELWEQRNERRPVLIVIDEAHNLCAPNPATPLESALTERLIQIAAEGRKYGLWLLLSTQRPSKIHPNVLSQCDNLALMRMSSARDLAELSEAFGYAPSELVLESPRFPKGRALFAGGFISAPTLVQMGNRLSVEGGADVAVPLR
ncbi:MAG: ATPase [Leifsonia sp.]|nr:ATPase [Leifsonia sp.]|tara:strand:- start:44444 stop:45517 length:1074 start_codon:yes stop_codon:yes gene_type:complete